MEILNFVGQIMLIAGAMLVTSILLRQGILKKLPVRK